jgi:hypothetical protein
MTANVPGRVAAASVGVRRGHPVMSPFILPNGGDARPGGIAPTRISEPGRMT